MKKIRVLTNAGILSPVDLRKLVNTARSYACGPFQFTDRNEIIFGAPETDAKTIMSLLQRNQFQCDDLSSGRQCIVSSYQANGILKTTSWLTDDVYLDVITSLGDSSGFKINIVDPLQALVPLFTGQLNFIASHHKNFWYLFIALPQFNKGEFWPALIYSDDIASVVSSVEKINDRLAPKNIDAVFEAIDSEAITNSRAIDKPLLVDPRFVPTYEGWHTGATSCWLGVYSKNYHYSLAFLEDLCDLCADKDIAKIYITSWRSLLIKNIKEHDRIAWETLLGKHGINTRHSYAELFWQIPIVSEDTLDFKSAVVAEFFRKDANTFGLYLGIAHNEMTVFANVVIKKESEATYTIFHTADFSPNNLVLIPYRENLILNDLLTSLNELTVLYHSHKEIAVPPRPGRISINAKIVDRYQCRTCQTIYNEKIGDIVGSIPAGTAFLDLPETYCCPVCEGSIADYAAMETALTL